MYTHPRYPVCCCVQLAVDWTRELVAAFVAAPSSGGAAGGAGAESSTSISSRARTRLIVGHVNRLTELEDMLLSLTQRFPAYLETVAPGALKEVGVKAKPRRGSKGRGNAGKKRKEGAAGRAIMSPGMGGAAVGAGDGGDGDDDGDEEAGVGGAGAAELLSQDDMLCAFETVLRPLRRPAGAVLGLHRPQDDVWSKVDTETVLRLARLVSFETRALATFKGGGGGGDVHGSLSTLTDYTTFLLERNVFSTFNMLYGEVVKVFAQQGPGTDLTVDDDDGDNGAASQNGTQNGGRWRFEDRANTLPLLAALLETLLALVTHPGLVEDCAQGTSYFLHKYSDTQAEHWDEAPLLLRVFAICTKCAPVQPTRCASSSGDVGHGAYDDEDDFSLTDTQGTQATVTSYVVNTLRTSFYLISCLLQKIDPSGMDHPATFPVAVTIVSLCDALVALMERMGAAARAPARGTVCESLVLDMEALALQCAPTLAQRCDGLLRVRWAVEGSVGGVGGAGGSATGGVAASGGKQRKFSTHDLGVVLLVLFRRSGLGMASLQPFLSTEGAIADFLGELADLPSAGAGAAKGRAELVSRSYATLGTASFPVYYATILTFLRERWSSLALGVDMTRLVEQLETLNRSGQGGDGGNVGEGGVVGEER